jgi:hypothetical protein
MPSLKRLAEFHKLGNIPFCVRCGKEYPDRNWNNVGGRLQRAHIIDRVCGGSDELSNIAPLCEWCHSCQPIFELGDEDAALGWFGLTEETRCDLDRFYALTSLRQLTMALCNRIPIMLNASPGVQQEVIDMLADGAKTPFLGR